MNSPQQAPNPPDHHVLSRLTAAFVDSKLVPLVILGALLLGLFAIVSTPSEEEPQIIVPMIDVMVEMPGATPAEVETRVVGPMEKLLWEIPGVEYVYSTAMDGKALTIVRFEVGQDTEKSVVKTYAKLYQHLDWIPPGCSQPILKPRSIDDVPILAVSFHGEDRDGRTLRQVAAEAAEAVRALPGVSEVTLTGGRTRAVTVEVDPDRLRALGLDALDVAEAIRSQNQAAQSGALTSGGATFGVRLDSFLSSEADVARVVVAMREGRPVYLADVANVRDGFEEPRDYVFFAPGPKAASKGIAEAPGRLLPAVTLTVAKRAGMNATKVSEAALERIQSLRGFAIPSDVQATVVRDYGRTAKDKSNELLEHLLIAAVSVGAIVAMFLGLRASYVVMVAVPVTLAVTLATYWFLGYTLNRVTLFALIFCIGILVDDPIVDVENIVRHVRLPGSQGRPFVQVITEAVNEVRAPLVLATFTVIAAIMPMGFVGGLMGPYMRPMPVGASVAMLLSMAVAFVITPWTSLKLLKPAGNSEHETHDDRFTQMYRRTMRRLITEPGYRRKFLLSVGGLLAGAVLFFPLKLVLVKMLPFDNKAEFEIVVDMPQGTPLEGTLSAAEQLSRVALDQPEVTDAQLYAGCAAPFSFNGLVRHYYLRQNPEQGEIQVNLVPRGKRSASSHEIAKRVREAMLPTASKLGARIKVVEVPPGPPVLQTLVAEIYGPTREGRERVARQVKEVFASTPNVVDVDWFVDDPRPETRIRVQTDKALKNGVDPDRARLVVSASLGGEKAGLLHDPTTREDVPIVVRLPLSRRASASELAAVPVRGGLAPGGKAVSLDQVATLEQAATPGAIYHKNMLPVVYVTGDMAGREESPVYGMARMDTALDELAAKGQGAWQTSASDRRELPRLRTGMPFSSADFSMKWDGEWQITYEVFRDMGLAFGVVMILIYILVVGWFGSYTTPIAIMSPIPLSLIGIIPAHALSGSFFTATSMIGFIAGAGIVVRNSIILVDFINLRRSEGHSLEDSVIEAGAVRFRPMLLTAISVVAGAFVILFDPIFQGLALSLLAGEVAATLFSRMVVPVMYYLDQRRSDHAA
ncbi:MAG: efflux RND transporter permease subunit [Humidesulfovibrio sp.]|uniref:efflux RND transporter permease subunit n=1 Tax=Humidesulfovibrio sp. TaxID=2910988 RepID=UPI0027EDE8B9|nr:efflux RND transporter permease subunit [Humidesulfovibrio sp.]MDQ7834845.1 efflux RND transporter permease subunit [Humidesulfovibrio sp.]